MAERKWWPKSARRVGNRWEYGSLTFWAEAGGVHIIDVDPRSDDPNTEKTISLTRWSMQVDMLRNYLKAAMEDQHKGTPTEVAKKAQHVYALQSAVRAGEEVARLAQFQGDCTNPHVQKYYKEHVAPVARTHLVPGAILP